MDGSDMNRGTGAGVYRWSSRWEHSFRFRPHTTLFQDEIYAIKSLIMEYTQKGFFTCAPLFFISFDCNNHNHAVTNS